MCSRPYVRMVIAVLLALLAHVTQASAAPPTDEEPSIEAAIQDGIALRRAGNDEGALTLFLDLERRNPQSVRVLLHATAAAQATGRWLLAHAYLRKASAFKNDAYYLRNRAAVKGIEDAVARHVGQFRVVGRPEGAEVKLSGKVIGTLPFREAVTVELGSYTLEVSKPGYYSLRREIAIGAGGALNQEIVELGRNAQPDESSAVRRVASRELQPTHDEAPGWWEARSVTWALAGVAVAGAGTSGVALAIRERNIEHWNDDGLCIDRQDVTRSREDICGSERDTAHAAGTIAVASGVVAALFATAALTHWLATSPKNNEQARAPRQASCGAGLGSIVCSGTF
jgi:PEGA domain